MQLTRLQVLAAGLLPGMASALGHSRRGIDCFFETAVDSGSTCASIAASWAISVDHFINLNPGVTCPNLDTSKPWCVAGDWTPDPTSTASQVPSTNTTARTSTTPSSAVQSSAVQSSTATTRSSSTSPATPSIYPTMPGIAPNCDRFYKIQSGDQCDTVASRNGITVAQLKSWNTEINAACSNLWLDYYICTRVPGAVLPSTTSTAPTPSNSPALPGVVSNCNAFYKIVSGDSCDLIAAKNKITVAQFRSWNTQINTGCSNLWLDYYTCVSVPGAATPMPGIVSNCNRFYQVVSGDGCDSIAQKAGVTAANFRRWNTFLNAACTNLWLNALVCTIAP